jgi:hypothetical protein
MRRIAGLACALSAIACSDNASGTTEPFVPLSLLLGAATANHGTAHGPVTVFNTQMRSELESPACNSDSKGHAQIKVNPDGSIASQVTINNLGAESVRFGHIHHLNAGAATGPIIWWLSSPIGTDLDLTDKHLQFAQAAAFVTNTHFADHAAALAELMANPQDFYVNFHSDACPGGFARGFLP